MQMIKDSLEWKRLDEDRERIAHWRHWGPYLSERQWGTVREDYSPGGTAWEYFPHDHARSRTYRWGEDGLLGISDDRQRLCFALALWNGNDPILKERLFGLTGNEGNHGEDVKEYYWYLDNLPSHAYMKALYRYPQREFPYAKLVEENRKRTRRDPEFELIDTGIFEGDRFFDVFVEYAKESPADLCIALTIVNRAEVAAKLHVLPTLWFRNVWSWKHVDEKPQLSDVTQNGRPVIEARHPELGSYYLYCEPGAELLFTENETNVERLFGVPNGTPYVKDGINDYVVSGKTDAVNPARIGTKVSAMYKLALDPFETRVLHLRLCDRGGIATPFKTFMLTLDERRAEADRFYAQLTPYPLSDDARLVQRQALAGMLWNKQFYYYVVKEWLDGDPLQPPPPPERRQGRNHEWIHLYNDDVLSMPDKWEYPWYAAWDLGFHVIPLALIDPDFAKRQLIQLTREWYMHPSGELPAYEWALSDVNPPVHAWAAYRVFRIEKKLRGEGDYIFLERVFQKLLMTFTWWVNRKDPFGNNVFQGGFLGLDNIGLFDRSATLPMGGHLNQSDGTSWMGVYALNMMAIALELAQHSISYEDIASKFFEHFLYISDAMNSTEHGREHGLWHEEDGFYYDVLALPNGCEVPLRVRSMVGLIPLMAVEVIEPETFERLPEFTKRAKWFVENRPDLCNNITCLHQRGVAQRALLSIVSAEQLRRLLKRMLDESEFLSPHGIRSVSRYHKDHPYALDLGGMAYSIDYEPAESTTGLFGGNSNWRGPVWFPLNYLLIEALQKFHYYYGDGFKVECPTGSGNMMHLWEVGSELSHRLMDIFVRDGLGRRAVFGGNERFQSDEHWHDYVPFYEYFNGETGAGLGASHQTGWTGLVAKLLHQCGEYCGQSKDPLTQLISLKA
jgi:hypothetical protein